LKPRKTLKDFIGSSKEYPVLAGFIIGFYIFTFYYSNNSELLSSWPVLFAVAGYYLLMPMAAVFLTYVIFSKTRFRKYTRQAVFIVTLSIFAFFILQNLSLTHSYKKIFVLVFAGIVGLSFKADNYKFVLLMVSFMAIFPLAKIAGIFYENATNPSDWNVQPDAILACTFKKTPNVYYIETDGYANSENLKGPLYHFDNSDFDGWLKGKGFAVYDEFRSNYRSTLKSNASCFNMKHHYSRENVGFKNAADFIMDDNPVLDIFRKNRYKTYFISERPYFMVSRPKIKFDYCNFEISEIPYLKDGWEVFKDVPGEVETQIKKNKDSRNFFFIQEFNPGHITIHAQTSKGIEGERLEYIERLKTANHWLKNIISMIESNDPDAIVIIGADHGGFVGFTCIEQGVAKITDKDLLNSVFGANLAIKWNGQRHEEYDRKLKTSVNLFRILFSCLSDDKKYLDYLQPDVSYNNYDLEDLRKIYKAIE